MGCLVSITSRLSSHSVLSDETISPSSLRAEFLTRPTILYRAGQTIYWEGDEANSVFLVAMGVLRISRCLVDGRRGVIGFLFPDEMLGLSARGKHAYTAEAITDCYVRALSREKVNSLLAETPNLREELITVLCEEISRTQTHLMVLSQRCAEERVANFILEVAAKSGHKLGSRVEIKIPMSRLDVADYLGLTVETVCRAFAKLKKANYIRTIGRGVVTIERMADLRDFACADADGPISSL